jgi:hypothetical protein
MASTICSFMEKLHGHYFTFTMMSRSTIFCYCCRSQILRTKIISKQHICYDHTRKCILMSKDLKLGIKHRISISYSIYWVFLTFFNISDFELTCLPLFDINQAINLFYPNLAQYYCCLINSVVNTNRCFHFVNPKNHSMFILLLKTVSWLLKGA